MKNMKNLLTSLLAAATVAASAFSLASCSSAGAKDLDKVQGKGTLVVGMECAYAPYNWAQTTENEYTVRVSDASERNAGDSTAGMGRADSCAECEYHRSRHRGHEPHGGTERVD